MLFIEEQMNWQKIITDYVEILRPDDYNVDRIYRALLSQIDGEVDEATAKAFIGKLIGKDEKLSGGVSNTWTWIIKILIILVVIVVIVIIVVSVLKINDK